MTSRERLTAGLLIAFIAAAVLGGVGYVFYFGPLGEKSDRLETLRRQNAEKADDLLVLSKELPKLKVAAQRSLPLDIDLAQQEYLAKLAQIIREAKIPGGAVTIKPRNVDATSAPVLPAPENAEGPAPPKRYAYTAVGYDITLQKVELAQVIEFLNRYYKLNLLHRLTKFRLTRDESANAARASGSNARLSDRPDLTVTLSTEAISVYGAEARRSLLSVPVAFGAAGGAAGWQALAQSSEPARGLTPQQLVPVLATAGREYTLTLVKDVFHGPPPPPPPPPAPPPEKEDTSPYIRLAGFGANGDGTGSALITDVASDQHYAVEVARSAEGKLRAVVKKSYATTEGLRKEFDPEPVLDISESTSATAVKFQVLGFVERGLALCVVGGRLPGADPDAKSGEARVVLWASNESLADADELGGEERAEVLAQLKLSEGDLPAPGGAASPKPAAPRPKRGKGRE